MKFLKCGGSVDDGICNLWVITSFDSECYLGYIGCMEGLESKMTKDFGIIRAELARELTDHYRYNYFNETISAAAGRGAHEVCLYVTETDPVDQLLQDLASLGYKTAYYPLPFTETTGPRPRSGEIWVSW